MNKRIWGFGLLAVGIIALGVFGLWWIGNRAIEVERIAKIEAERAAQEQLIKQINTDLQAVATTTLETIATAVTNKRAPLAQLQPEDITKNHYNLADLTLVSQETTKARQIYQTALKKALTSYSAGLTGDETTAMLDYLDTRSTTTLKIIEDSEKNLAKTVATLAKMTVPASASFLHLQLLNHLASLRQIIYNMGQVASEPLLASQSAEQRVKAYTAVLTAISGLDRYFAQPITP